jgi:hypothetical protein
MNRKKKTKMAVSALIVIAVTFTFAQGQLSLFAKADYLKFVDQRVDLTWAWTEYEICNPEDYKYVSGMALEWFGDTDTVISSEVQIREFYNEVYERPVYSDVPVCRKRYLNETKGPDICWNVTALTGYANRTVQKMRWVPWNGEVNAKPVLSATATCERVRVYAKLKPVLGPRSIDHVPSVFGYDYPEYSWWDTDWTYRTRIDTNTTSDTTNFQFRVNVSADDLTDVQNDFDDIRFLTDCTSGGSALNSWLEDKQDGVSALMWVNMTAPAYTNVASICMYYGNGGVSDTWNGNLTMYFYTGFEDIAAGTDLNGVENWAGTAAQFSVEANTPFQGSNSLEWSSQLVDFNIVNTDANSASDTAGWVYGWKARGNGGDGQQATWMMNGGSVLWGLYFWSSNDIKVLTRDEVFTDIDDYTSNIWYYQNISFVNATSSVACHSSNADGAGRCFSDENRNANSPMTAIRLNSDAMVGTGMDILTDDIYVANYSIDSFTHTFGAEESSPSMDKTPPQIFIQEPRNITYSNNSIWFNVTLNETGGECLVAFGGTNKSLANSSGNWNYLNSSMLTGSYNAIFWCDDVNNNYNTTSVRFTVDNCLYLNNSGDYDVNETCILLGEWLNIDGNLTIFEAGQLNITNSTLNFTSTHQWIRFENGTQTDKLIMLEFSSIN